jgi:alpha-L-rhamnosidase
MITGLVLHNDTPLVGTFACSDPVLTRLSENARWTQRANFIEVPTDCPQRDERLGWMGDAAAYVGTATYYADVAAFFTKWMEDVVESQRSFGAFPDYAPYPMAHGPGQQTFGSAWTDAGVMVPWTLWRAYGDRRLVERHWEALTRFMEWRHATASPEGLGSRLGNPWGDWLNLDDPTPLELVDTCYAAKVTEQMVELARAVERPVQADVYQRRLARMKAAFVRQYRKPDGDYALPSQSSHVLALWAGLIPKEDVPQVVQSLVGRIARNDTRMSTGFLGTRSLLSVLSENGQHDLAVRLFQSRRFPSWGYAVANGANTVWERWDSYTAEHGFNGANGKQNAAMNSFSHYAFGAVMEWAFRELAGIGGLEPGSRCVLVRPRLPSPAGNPEAPPITWVAAQSEIAAGRVATEWRRDGKAWTLAVVIPANATARVRLERAASATVSESGQPLPDAPGVRAVRAIDGDLEIEVGSGDYVFAVAPSP